jgi:3-dehydroquinate dehydratase / shikimate dehydrogenase
MDSPQKPRICIAICESTVAALEDAMAAAAEACDLIELRLDCLEPPEWETKANVITKLVGESACESILTFRPAEQGGRRELDDETRHAFWSDAIFSGSFFDVELDVAERFNSTSSSTSLPIDWSRTICSHHDFNGVPSNLDQIYDRMAATPARILKIAVQANDATDCLPVFHLLERARKQGREIIGLAMGTAGIATRLLSPSRGAFLTYASLTSEAGTAPGQISAAELREVYRLENITQQTEIFGLIGRPVSHSVSPLIHNAAFAAVGKDAVFIPFEVNDVKAFIKRMTHPRTRELDWNVRGLGVTAPHKSSVMDLLDSLEPAAREIGAVNTIVIEGDQLRGHNTDARGFITPLLQKFGNLRGARCAIMGAGGSAKAAIWSLKQAGAEVTVLARNGMKGSLLAELFGAASMKLEAATFEDFDVVINATPLGTAGQLQDETVVAGQQLRGARLAYDLVYNPTETRFLREARAAGCETLGGLAMLVGQATEQFRLWTGGVAPEDVMYEAAQRGLKR